MIKRKRILWAVIRWEAFIFHSNSISMDYSLREKWLFTKGCRRPVFKRVGVGGEVGAQDL